MLDPLNGDVSGNWKTPAAIDALSLVCFSRPATLLLDPGAVRAPGADDWSWWIDLAHLGALVVAVWIVAWTVFRRQEQTWPRLLGL